MGKLPVKSLSGELALRESTYHSDSVGRQDTPSTGLPVAHNIQYHSAPFRHITTHSLRFEIFSIYTYKNTVCL